MKKAILVLSLAFFMLESFGQPNNGSNKLFRCIIKDLGGAKTVGVLIALGDSSVQCIDIAQAKDARKSQYDTSQIHIYSIGADQIDVMKFRKNGTVARGALVGGLIGMAIGGVIGSASYTPCTSGWFSPCLSQELSIAGGAMLGLPAGVLVGVLAMTGKTFQIEGSQELYQQQKAEMERYLFRSTKIEMTSTSESDIRTTESYLIRFDLDRKREANQKIASVLEVS